MALVGGAGLYLAAFFLSAANPYYGPPDPRYQPWPGYTVFRLGWVLITKWEKDDPFVGMQLVVVTAWMANPAIWLAIGAVSCRRWWWTRLFAGVGLALALAPLVLPQFADALAGQPGYWMWAASAALLFAIGWHARTARMRVPHGGD